MTTLLLVEDNGLNRNMLSRRLKKMDYKVLLAVDGQDGVEKTKNYAPDLVLMDINMPILDGWEALRILKNDPTTNNIPVIALTAHAAASDKDKAAKIGFDGFAAKPIDFPELLKSIEDLLHGMR